MTSKIRACRHAGRLSGRMFLLEVCHSYSQLTSPNDAAALQSSSQISMKPSSLSRPTAAAAPASCFVTHLQSSSFSPVTITRTQKRAPATRRTLSIQHIHIHTVCAPHTLLIITDTIQQLQSNTSSVLGFMQLLKDTSGF